MSPAILRHEHSVELCYEIILTYSAPHRDRMSESKSSCARLLIANRGEIAVRIVRAAHSLGIETVLAASAADCGSLAAQESDRTVVLGAAPARGSYLNAPRIMHAAFSTACSSFHPVHGFLSY